MRVHDVGSEATHLRCDVRRKARQQAGKQQGMGGAAKTLVPATAVREDLEPIGGVAGTTDIRPAHQVTARQALVVRGHNGDLPPGVTLQVREIGQERGRRINVGAGERSGDMKNSDRHAAEDSGARGLFPRRGTVLRTVQQDHDVPAMTGVRRRDRRAGRSSDWLEAVLAFALRALVAYGISAMPLAIAGVFHPAPVALGTALTLVVLSAVWGRRQPGGTGRSAGTGSAAGTGAAVNSPPSPWPARIAIGIAVLSALVNVAFSSEHLLGDRDPGAYVITARWLANEGSLEIDAGTAQFDSEPTLTYAEQAFSNDDSEGKPSKLYPQFVHLLPVVLAGAMALVGTAVALKLPAVLGAVSLLVFFVFARRIVRPWLALAAMAALSVNLVQVHVSRDAFSEVLVQLLLFGGLWMLWDARDRLDPPRALIAGLLLGACCMARVDGLLLLAPLSAYGFVEAVRMRGLVRQGDDRSQRGMFLLALAVGLLLTTNLALADLVMRSPEYLDSLGTELTLTAGAVGAVWLVGPVVLVIAWRGRGIGNLVVRHRRTIGAIAACGALALAAFAVLVRPQLPMLEANGSAVKHIASLQRQQGLTVDATRTYDEESVYWLWWYAGIPVLAVAVMAWAFQLRRAVLGRVTRQLPFLLCLSTITIAYLWQHGATPDQVWAARRLLPITLPGVILLAVLFVEHMLRVREPADAEPPGDHDPLRRSATPRQWFAWAFAVAMVAWPLATLVPVARARAQGGMLKGIERVCDAMTPNAAVVVLTGRDTEKFLAQTLRSFCEVPVAIAPASTKPETLTRLARSWKEARRTLHFVTGDPTLVDGIPNAGVVDEIRVTSEATLESTVERRPRRLIHTEFQVLVAASTTDPD